MLAHSLALTTGLCAAVCVVIAVVFVLLLSRTTTHSLVIKSQLQKRATLSRRGTDTHRNPSHAPRKTSSVAVITAIFGGYETTCKPVVPQSIPCDFICFTDGNIVASNGWQVDKTTHHLLSPSPDDTGVEHNSLRRNKHPFNIAKYYKQAFWCIPRLSDYEFVIWMDGTLEVTHPEAVERLVSAAKRKNIVVWKHSRANLAEEIEDSKRLDKYTHTEFNGYPQPVQDLDAHYKAIVRRGYTDEHWKTVDPSVIQPPVWVTCMVVFDMNAADTIPFLRASYRETLLYTTQDQVSFTAVLFDKRMTPHTLPNADIKGRHWHDTQLYHGHSHGR